MCARVCLPSRRKIAVTAASHNDAGKKIGKIMVHSNTLQICVCVCVLKKKKKLSQHCDEGVKCQVKRIYICAHFGDKRKNNSVLRQEK